MIAIIIAIVLAFILQLAMWQVVILGLAWIINAIFTVGISYVLVGGIVFAIWIVILLIKVLFVYGAYKEAD